MEELCPPLVPVGIECSPFLPENPQNYYRDLYIPIIAGHPYIKVVGLAEENPRSLALSTLPCKASPVASIPPPHLGQGLQLLVRMVGVGKLNSTLLNCVAVSSLGYPTCRSCLCAKAGTIAVYLMGEVLHLGYHHIYVGYRHLSGRIRKYPLFTLKASSSNLGSCPVQSCSLG